MRIDGSTGAKKRHALLKALSPYTLSLHPGAPLTLHPQPAPCTLEALSPYNP
mgnify:CR=1 FL=1